MKEGLLQAWNIHDQMNLLVLQNLEESSLSMRLGAKGRSIGEQFMHMHNNRIAWLEFVAKALYNKGLMLEKQVVPTLAVLSGAFQSSAQKINEVIELNWDKAGKLPGFKTGLIPFVTYLVSHESHHRGNILLTLKQGGIKIPDELKWGLWDWAKKL